MEPKRIDTVLAELKGLWPSMPEGNRRVVMAMEEAHEVITVLAARLAEVERERDRMEAEAVVAMDRWHQSQARAERLEAALERIQNEGDARANAIATAALQQEGGE
jgi:hypothetical protein